jgi:predicted Zn-dependent protease
MGQLGKQVASDKFSIVDDGANKNLVGSKGITCEGLPTGRTELIKDGRLVGLLSNYYETQRLVHDPAAKEKLGADPKDWTSAFVPRNGFRYARGGGRHFDAQPQANPTNVIIPGDLESTEAMCRLVGNGIYVGRMWYTYPVNGTRAGDFTGTVVADSYVIRDGKLAEPIRANTLRINDNLSNWMNGVIGVSKQGHPTLVWAADEIVYAPEVAVEKVRIDAIAEYMESV